jgi:hypothetical protein
MTFATVNGISRAPTNSTTRPAQSFFSALGTPDCLTQVAIANEADRRGWDWLIEPTYEWQSCPATASPWLRVMVQPSLFISTDNENSAFFVFDAQGCSIDWREASNCND